MGIIFYVSHQPGDLVRLPPIYGLDKLLHVAAYSLLGGAFLFGMQPFSRKSNYVVIAAAAIILCTVYGFSDELHQSFVPGRFSSIWDVLADGSGGLLAAGIWLRMESKRCKAEL
jgi:VanZ family protein